MIDKQKYKAAYRAFGLWDANGSGALELFDADHPEATDAEYETLRAEFDAIIKEALQESQDDMWLAEDDEDDSDELIRIYGSVAERSLGKSGKTTKPKQDRKHLKLVGED